MYERKGEALIEKKEFTIRMLYHLLAALLLVIVTVTIGIAGHFFIDDMNIGSALIASITLVSGIGLSIVPETFSGQLFASLYGIFSGYIYIATSSIIIAPVLHRILHKFHLDE